MVEHLLLHCHTHEEERKESRDKIGWRRMRIPKLLGDPKIVKDTVGYVTESHKLSEGLETLLGEKRGGERD